MVQVVIMSVLTSLVLVGGCSADSSQKIIDNLEPGQAYACVQVKGSKEPVVLVADETYECEGVNAAIRVHSYVKDVQGKYKEGEILYSDSTNTPIRISEDGEIICLTHHSADYYVARKKYKKSEISVADHYGGELSDLVLEEYEKSKIIAFKVKE